VVTYLFVILAIGVITVVAVLVTGRYSPAMGIFASGDYRPETTASNPSTQFDVVIRGYRMDEVDAKIAELENKIQESSRP
jgi:hypothetical protein